MPAKTIIATAAAMLVAAPALAQGWSRLGASAFSDPYERGYDQFREQARERADDRERALAQYYGYGTYLSPYDRDYRWPERVERDRGGALSYDRDYPYDFRYGGRGVTGEGLVASSRGIERTTVGHSLAIERGVRVFRGGDGLGR